MTDETKKAIDVPQVGIESAAKMVELTDQAAAEINELGRVIVKAANDIAADCSALADTMTSMGVEVANKTRAFAALCKEVGVSNFQTKQRLLDPASIVRSAKTMTEAKAEPKIDPVKQPDVTDLLPGDTLRERTDGRE